MSGRLRRDLRRALRRALRLSRGRPDAAVEAAERAAEPPARVAEPPARVGGDPDAAALKAAAPLAAAMALIAAATNRPTLLPESLEIIGSGRCLVGLSAPLECGDIEVLYWSPAYPLLAAPIAGAMDPLLAGGLVSLVATAAGLYALAALLGPRLGAAPALAAVAAVGATPAVGGYAMAVDARATAAALLLGAAAAAAAPGGGGRRQGLVGAAAGALAAAAALTRPEQIAALPILLALCGVGALTGARGAGGGSLRGVAVRLAGWAAGAAALLGPWAAALSLAEGRPSLLPRGVQAIGFALTDAVPQRWARQAIGEGAARLPLREAARGGPWPIDLPPSPGLDLSVGAAWLIDHLPALSTGWGWGLALAGAAAMIGRRRWGALLALAALAAPSAAAAVALPGRDDELPVSALLPGIIALQALQGIALGVAAQAAARRAREAPRQRLASLAAALLALGSARFGPALALPESPDNAPSGAAIAGALAEALPPGTSVAAPFASSLAVRRAGMRWVPWPAPWERSRWLGPEGPSWALLGAPDADITPLDLGLPEGLRLEPRAAYGDGGTSVVLFSVESEASSSAP